MKKILLFCFLMPLLGDAQIITTIAGTGLAGYSGNGGPAISANLNGPGQVAIDKAGNIYFADYGNNCVRKVDTSGIISLVAGTGVAGYNGDGILASTAELNGPVGVSFDTTGSLYISERNGNRIRRINTSGMISTIAGTGAVGLSGDGGPATAAQIWFPMFLTTDSIGNIYFADNQNSRIRKIDGAGTITTIAGSGPAGYSAGYSGDGGLAIAAQLSYPAGVWVNGGNILIADGDNHAIRKINSAGIISTIAGTGVQGYNGDGIPATIAQLHTAQDVIMDKKGNVYIADLDNNRIRRIDTNGIIATIAGDGIAGYDGDGGLATAAELYGVNGICFNAAGTKLYFADVRSNRIRQIYNEASLGASSVTTSGNTFTLYPNPNNGVFTVTGNIKATGDQRLSLRAVDVLGREVYFTNLSAHNSSINATVNIGNDVAPGVYYLQVTAANGSDVFRFAIEK